MERYWGFVAHRAHRERLEAAGVPCRFWTELSKKERVFWIQGALKQLRIGGRVD